MIAVAKTGQLAVGVCSGRSAARSLRPGPTSRWTPRCPPRSTTWGLREALPDEAWPLFDRYCARFALRSAGGEEAAPCPPRGGLRAGPAAARAAALARRAESPTVRHECAEALGAIAQPACLAALRAHAADPERAVRESCGAALDVFQRSAGGLPVCGRAGATAGGRVLGRPRPQVLQPRLQGFQSRPGRLRTRP